MAEISNNIAFIGNPNCGKSTLFNRLTGLRQKTSNLPGTTVEKKTGTWNDQGQSIALIDLPGIYSLYTESDEERIVVDHLLGLHQKQKPKLLLFLLDASNLRRNLLLYSQVAELDIPIVVALTMLDTAKRRGIAVNTANLEKELGVPVVALNPRTGEGIAELGAKLSQVKLEATAKPESVLKLTAYRNGEPVRGLSTETLNRYKTIELIVKSVVQHSETAKASLTRKLDALLTHKYLGFVFFGLIMLTIFQGVFTLAEYPMTWIETGFSKLTLFLSSHLAQNVFSDILTGGILPGLSGLLVFLPQIAILFFFISLLEDSGYMVRASFITDKLMQKIGLNGRSVIPLIGAFACAIPSIMATRSIKNRRERLTTMFIIPLMSCSARLPVYVLLVSLAIPSGSRFGPFGLQSLVMTLAYFAGILCAIAIAAVIKLRKREKQPSEFILELPPYQLPRLQTAWSNVLHKSMSFVKEAGKIIMLISLVLWFLSSYGPGNAMEKAAADVIQTESQIGLSNSELQAHVNAAKLKASYAGMMGQWIEPVIRPLGYDWKTGIALISSFAAREVFVGTMSTLFNDGDTKNVEGIRQKMQKAKDPATGKPLYGASYAFSLIIFYAFALQCMSTLAVMKRETGSWRLPILQFLIFGGIAYVAAWLIFTLSSSIGLG